MGAEEEVRVEWGREENTEEEEVRHVQLMEVGGEEISLAGAQAGFEKKAAGTVLELALPSVS